ncbi:hypothetical protein HDU85_006055 [Gaertneriomyces sp. JEL0708]|nr:hypothetical protein HDU85_006055 [Gaertneriomyces sp. JEL0708]
MAAYDVPSYTIYIRDPNDEPFAHIPTPREGRPAAEVGIFLSILTSGALVPTENAFLFPAGGRKGGDEDGISLTGDQLVTPGSYYVVGGMTELCPAGATPRLFPPLTPSAGRSGSSSSSHLRSRSSTPTPQPQDDLAREAGFRDNCIQRDRFCVVTGTANLSMCVGCRIVPFAWKKNRMISLLPVEIREHIQELPNGVDDVGNGFLARDDLYNAFDKGYWSVKVSDGVPCFFGIITAYRSSALHGRPLYLPQGQTPTVCEKGIPSGRHFFEDFPSRTLWGFHFRCAVFAHMKASGEDTGTPRSLDDDRDALAALHAELDAMEDLGFEGTAMGDIARKVKGDLVKEFWGGIAETGVPVNIPPAYLWWCH